MRQDTSSTEEDLYVVLASMLLFIVILTTLVFNLSWVTVKATRLKQLLNAQDLTSAPQSALSFRAMLNLPNIGWRVHQIREGRDVDPSSVQSKLRRVKLEVSLSAPAS